jgi:hypothetical protein
VPGHSRGESAQHLDCLGEPQPRAVDIRTARSQLHRLELKLGHREERPPRLWLRERLLDSLREPLGLDDQTRDVRGETLGRRLALPVEGEDDREDPLRGLDEPLGTGERRVGARDGEEPARREASPALRRLLDPRDRELVRIDSQPLLPARMQAARPECDSVEERLVRAGLVELLLGEFSRPPDRLDRDTVEVSEDAAGGRGRVAPRVAFLEAGRRGQLAGALERDPAPR